MKNTTNSIMMCPLREQAEREEPRRGNDGILEVEEEKEDEELGSCSSESRQPRLVISVDFLTFSQIKGCSWLGIKAKFLFEGHYFYVC